MSEILLEKRNEANPEWLIKLHLLLKDRRAVMEQLSSESRKIAEWQIKAFDHGMIPTPQSVVNICK